MNRISKLFAISVLATLMLIVGCSDDSTGPSGPGPYNATLIEIYDGAHLANGYFYQLWATQTGDGLASSTELDWTSVLEFNLNPAEAGAPGVITTITGQVISENTFSGLSIDFEDYDSLIISIEQPGASSGTPSPTVISAVHIPDDFTLQTIGILWFPENVDSASASFYQLATPTDADTSNERSGVWFMQNMEPPIQGLTLKYAPSGWLYEGWAWHNNTWLSTGKFASPGLSDDFSGHSNGADPGFPGEDFLTNAPVGETFPWIFEQGDSVLLTLEPNPDPDDAPFAVRLLGHQVQSPEFQHNRTATPLLSTVEMMPSGSLTFKRSEDL